MLDLLPDLFDDYSEQLQLAEPLFNDYGGNTIFCGEIVTVSCFNDNSKVKEHVSPRLRHPHRPQCATAVAQRCLLHLCRHRLPVGAVCPASSPGCHFASAR